MCIYDADVIRIAIKILGQNKINAFNCEAYIAKIFKTWFLLAFFAFSGYHRGLTKSVIEVNETEWPKIFGQNHKETRIH